MMKQNIQNNLIKQWFKNFFIVSLWYTGITLIILTILTGRIYLGYNESINLVEAQQYVSIGVFMFVLGIVLPLCYMEQFTALGVTRVQQFKGILTAAFLDILTLVVANSVLGILTNLFQGQEIKVSYILRGIPANTMITLAFFLLGWIIALGFTYGRFITRFSSILLSILGINGIVWIWESNLKEPAFDLLSTASTMGGSWLFYFIKLGLVTVIGILLGFVAWKGMKELRFKC